jgi:hypothetical protein
MDLETKKILIIELVQVSIALLQWILFYSIHCIVFYIFEDLTNAWYDL